MLDKFVITTNPKVRSYLCVSHKITVKSEATTTIRNVIDLTNDLLILS